MRQEVSEQGGLQPALERGATSRRGSHRTPGEGDAADCGGDYALSRAAAALGAMVVTEQVDTMELMGRDPVGYVVVRRVLARSDRNTCNRDVRLAASMLAGWAIALLTTRATTPNI